MSLTIRRKLGRFSLPVGLFSLGIVIGLFIAVQIQVSQNITRTPNPSTPNLELQKTADKIKKEQDNLKEGILDLRKKSGKTRERY